ncbi:MAG: hypothetical protein HYT10_01935 [Candidatus Levybacteria bacterium]|nr:hypothetical protein [Candidatus Levybacteria bacterium]
METTDAPSGLEQYRIHVDEALPKHLKEVESDGREAQRHNVIGNLAGTLPVEVRLGILTEAEAKQRLAYLNQKLEDTGFGQVNWEELFPNQSTEGEVVN